MSKEILTADELAELLGVKPKTIRLWTYDKKLPFFHVGRLLRFRLDAILEWAAQLEKATAQPAPAVSTAKKAKAQKPAALGRKRKAARKAGGK